MGSYSSSRRFLFGRLNFSAMLQMLLAAGSAAAVAWFLFSKKKADNDVTKKEKQDEKTINDKAHVVKPSNVDNRMVEVETPDELAAVPDMETKPVEEIARVALPQQVDQASAAPITAEAPSQPQDAQQVQQEVLIPPSLDQPPPPVPIQEIPSAAPQLNLASSEDLDEVPVEMASPAPAQGFASPAFETAPFQSATPIIAVPTEPTPLLTPQNAQEILVPPLPDQPPPVPIQEIPIAAPQLNLASSGNLYQLPIEMSSPVLVPQVLTTSAFETAPFPSVSIETPLPVVETPFEPASLPVVAAPTELTAPLLAPPVLVPVELASPAPLPSVQEPPPAPIPIIAPQLNLASPGDLAGIPVEMASTAPVVLVPQLLATPEPELVIPVKLLSPAPLPSAPPPVIFVPLVLSSPSASNEAPPLSVAAPVDSAPVSPQHQPQVGEKDSQDGYSSDHLIVSKPTTDQGQTIEQSPSSPVTASPEEGVLTALDIDLNMVPEPQVNTARETPTTPISTAKEVSDVEKAENENEMRKENEE